MLGITAVAGSGTTGAIDVAATGGARGAVAAGVVVPRGIVRLGAAPALVVVVAGVTGAMVVVVPVAVDRAASPAWLATVTGGAVAAADNPAATVVGAPLSVVAVLSVGVEESSVPRVV